MRRRQCFNALELGQLTGAHTEAAREAVRREDR